MIPAVAKLQSTLEKPFLPPIFFLGGVAYDTVTLSRIDRLIDNLTLLFYLSLLGALVIVHGRFQLGLVPRFPPDKAGSLLALVHAVRPHLPKAMHFLLGGLFSAYTIFYSQSASLTTSAAFLAAIVLLLIANEFLHVRLLSLKLWICLYALVVLSFLTFFLPVLTGWMSSWVFLAGALLSGGVVWKIVQLVFVGSPARFSWEPLWTMAPAFLSIVLVCGFYFWNLIPPVPLSLKYGGIYNQVEKLPHGFQLTYEVGAWYEIWKRSSNPVPTQEPAFCFAAVFAPVTLETTIYHHWQHRRSGENGEYTTTDRIPILISGGRGEGYRGFTVKQHLDPGDWRVDVETEDGRVIGRITFEARDREDSDRRFQTIVY